MDISKLIQDGLSRKEIMEMVAAEESAARSKYDKEKAAREKAERERKLAEEEAKRKSIEEQKEIDSIVNEIAEAYADLYAILNDDDSDWDKTKEALKDSIYQEIRYYKACKKLFGKYLA